MNDRVLNEVRASRLLRWPESALRLVAGAASILLLAGILLRPVSNNLTLYGSFVLLGGVAALAVLRTRPRIPVEMLVIAFGVGLVAVYGIAIGPSNPGLPYTLLIWVLAPTLWWIVAAASTLRLVRWFFVAAAAVTLVSSGILIVFVAGASGLVPQLVPGFVETQLGLGATFSGGGSQARMYGLSSLVALGPMWVASVFVARDELLPPLALRILCAGAATLAAVISNRTAIAVVIALAPILLIACIVLAPVRTPTDRRYRPAAVGWALLGAATAAGLAAAVPGLDRWGPIRQIVDNVGSLLTGSPSYDSADQSIRADQATQLLRAWSTSPLFGAGFGARVPEYARTSERPWVLELQYHLLAFNIGIIGLSVLVIVLAAGLALVYRALVAAPQFRSSMLVALVAALSMLIGNASNPYLQAPGHTWAVFLPLALACAIFSATARRQTVEGGARQMWEDRR